jgi:hypothetical protein
MKRFLFFVFVIVFITSCKKKSSGYSDVRELYRASMTALQSKDIKKIRKFVEEALPDAGTIQALKNKGYNYRGIPDELKERPTALKDWKTDFANSLLELADELDGQGILNDLKFIGFDEEYLPEEIEKGTGILFMEPFGRFATTTDTIEYKIGEVLKINGKWKSFTEAKL